ncbi:lipopolysaccharide kinase InaA family protein [Aegicerativicinus sediminis]|uniref:lipopolysaccharide kinase InaA family protein n=1 Tax=Aegicerativicinus sediminis TaxID=2893202 RepID=UPI001E3698D9|nr:lipopolysaccharide kinase InaA family protein [Aegicerativicinus sediminis]
MKRVIDLKYQGLEKDLDALIENFSYSGKPIGKGVRNKIKYFTFKGKTVNVKAFKVPNIINQLVYRFLRKSKAERSFFNAKKLLEMGILTPEPVAYYEFYSFILLKRSFYVCEHLSCDYTYRDLINNKVEPSKWDTILREFTKFTYRLHENGILFLDHSPGNTLINEINGYYSFYLVDLNRMKFKPPSLEERLKNFSRLTPRKDMVEIMSEEYAGLMDLNKAEVFQKMWFYTEQFQNKFQRKKELKKKLLFWRS